MFNKIIAFLTGTLDRPEVGDVIPVGEFFWIPDDAIIGYTEDAKHGHRFTGGSVDIDCTVKVIDVLDRHVVVELDRPTIPYGAPAPIGTVFFLSIKQINTWPEMIESNKNKADAKARLMNEYYS